MYSFLRKETQVTFFHPSLLIVNFPGFNTWKGFIDLNICYPNYIGKHASCGNLSASTVSFDNHG